MLPLVLEFSQSCGVCPYKLRWKNIGGYVKIRQRMAKRATSSKDAAELIESLHKIPTEVLQTNAQARKTALNLSRKLTAALYDPADLATETLYTPFILAAARIAVDLHLFELLVNHGREISTEELAQKTDAENLLLNRLLRTLSSVGFVEEIEPDQWLATPTTIAMATPGIAAAYRCEWDFTIPSAMQAPRYLRESGSYRCPTDPTNGFFQLAHQTRYSAFDYLSKLQPERIHDFNVFMGNTMGARNYWVDWYPIKERLLEGADANLPLLVDVGGGKGHDLQAFKAKYPYAEGRLILQELPLALGSIEAGALHETIECQEHDFFTPNPVRGARAYFLHHVLHDWSESYCLKILDQIRAAMSPGYSRLLIHELILPDKAATTFQTAFDMMMMAFNGGAERSRAQWTDLLQKAGFEVVEFLHGQDGEDADGIVEAIIKK